MGATSSRTSISAQYKTVFTPNEQAILLEIRLTNYFIQIFLVGWSYLVNKNDVYTISTASLAAIRDKGGLDYKPDPTRWTSNDALRATAWLIRSDCTENITAWWWLIMTALSNSTALSLVSFLTNTVQFVWQQQNQPVPTEQACKRLGFDIEDEPSAHWPTDSASDSDDTTEQLFRRDSAYQHWLKQCQSTFSENTISLEEFRSWLSRSEAAQALLLHLAESILLKSSSAALISRNETNLYGLNSESSITSRLLPQLTGNSTCLLDSTDRWLLARHMPTDCRLTWRLVFSTRHHGNNWQHFASALLQSASTLIVIREARPSNDDVNKETSIGSRTFGGFVQEPWRKLPDFYGNADSFLFTQQPTGPLCIHMATSTNSNYQYFNYSTKSLPNGMGMGGQLNYFGLWIAADNFGVGQCKAAPLNSTFRCPQLSTEPQFKIEDMEVWCVRELEPNSDNLPLHSDAAAILEMAGRTMYSKQLRDPDLDQDN
ncbi:TLD-domain-containing protein [Syncephalis fuscata]|nr:TLD-domain-containing protein [Syncephalis fuscata]